VYENELKSLLLPAKQNVVVVARVKSDHNYS
jgi:hypothetical protein